LTYEKLKAFLGQFDVEAEDEEDESYVRELYHFCRELDGTKRIHRSP
jgi:hypothetical protein